MALNRRKRRPISVLLARLEESIMTLRDLQRRGQPAATVYHQPTLFEEIA